jgi:uncharacterized membrane protein YbjE (DUF340 family)
MFTIIGIMLTGMLLGYLLRSKRLTWIHKVITLLIWLLLFLLGIDVGGNEAIVKGLHAIGLEALIITAAACRNRKHTGCLGTLVSAPYTLSEKGG